MLFAEDINKMEIICMQGYLFSDCYVWLIVVYCFTYEKGRQPQIVGRINADPKVKQFWVFLRENV